MGCCQKQVIVVDDRSIIVHLKKTKSSLESNLEQLKINASKRQSKLIKLFNKPLRQRIKVEEEGEIQQIVFANNMREIIAFLAIDIQRLIDNEQLIIKSTVKSNDFTYNFERILYYSDIVDNAQFKILIQTIKNKYPTIKQVKNQEIKQKIVQYHKNSTKISPQMATEYILKLSGRQPTLNIDQINQLGHNFRFGNH